MGEAVDDWTIVGCSARVAMSNKSEKDQGKNQRTVEKKSEGDNNCQVKET